MDTDKSLDNVSNIIAALLTDVQTSHGVVFNARNLKLTLKKVNKRLRSEGIGFLTKTLPKLGKAFDKAIASAHPLNAADHGFKPMENSKLPRFLGEFFSRVLDPAGSLLPHPCEQSVAVIRQVLYLFYKYELPYTDEQEQKVIDKFKGTEDDLAVLTNRIREIGAEVDKAICLRHRLDKTSNDIVQVARRARMLLCNVFAFFDPRDIRPRHGPGAVATKQKLWEKYQWSNVSNRITDKYPLDEYYYASPGHVCDCLNTLMGMSEKSLPARVCLVPKDSRGPRLISCEPVDYQWIQQGLGRAITAHVERHPLTKWNVFFTSQDTNRYGALLGSSTGRYATLDLNEASDRVSLELVRLLFPPHLCEYLEACRSLSTVLPDGKELPLNKFAPMGSALCFPILALTVWAILTAAAPNGDTREGIAVFGDDVIVPTDYSANAIEQLESFGLKVNRDKSCTSGLFRESCGMDAFNGVTVTPVRLRTVWSSSRSPDTYTSWIAYANSFWERGYLVTYDYIVSMLHHVYGAIPSKDMNLSCPSLAWVPDEKRPKSRRVNKSLQKLEFKVWDIKSPTIHKTIDGWSMLLRFFVEAGQPPQSIVGHRRSEKDYSDSAAFSVSSYTSRGTSMLVRRWR